MLRSSTSKIYSQGVGMKRVAIGRIVSDINQLSEVRLSFAS